MTKVAARKTQLIELPLEQAVPFVAAHHSQGAPQLGKKSRALALIFEGDLVGVAIFGNPRTALKQSLYTTELIRLCFKTDWQVIGGASKLIKGYIKRYAPANLFTYQTLDGAKTDVYALSGMTLVKEVTHKKILVKNGLTQATAKNNYRDWLSISEAARLGPDRILGTSLGEVFAVATKKRYSNIELFIQYCDYHLEVVAGDRVYEWHNPNVTYYCYKISSTVDDGYYIGRRMLRKAHATVEDCRKDGYMGSGGGRFTAWVSKVGVDNLTKEIISIHRSYGEASKEERALIGDLHRTDPRCKNSIPGGGFTAGVASKPKLTLQLCSIHGETTHQGPNCSSCHSLKSVSLKVCPTHGLVNHQGDLCYNCKNEALVTLKECPIHGATKFQGAVCMKCNSFSQFSLQECPIHGEVKFKGESCTSCTSQKAISLKVCPTHGEVKHQGSTCLHCHSQNAVQLKVCLVHGAVKHQGNACSTCNANKSVQMSHCSKHGMTKHQGGKCSSCSNASLVTIKFCSSHGETKHRGDACYACFSQKKSEKNLMQKLEALEELGFTKERLTALVLQDGLPMSELVKIINHAGERKVVYRANLQRVLEHWGILEAL